MMSYLTCLNCGGDTRTEELSVDGPYTRKKIECHHCENEGMGLHSSGMGPSWVEIEGNFAKLSEEGVRKVQENAGFEPVYEQ